ncbi:MAG: hypothetical protein Q6354_08420, partial [Candidatus Brocadiales bacterium]|nr:hypothetical protein [Candidatus Brocadiales bacterium]
MDFFRNFLDSVLPAKEWSITFSGLQEPWLRALLLAVALSVLLFSWMGLRTFPWGKGLLIMLLRTLATLALVFMTLEPQVELKDTARIRNKVALILDNSKSMSIKAEGEGRFEGIKKFLLGNKAFLELLERDFDLDFLSFSDQVKEVSRKVLEEGMPLEGTSTDLATMLRSIKKRYQGKPVSGFLLFSDGADTSSVPIQEKLEELEKLAGELPAPLFAFSPAPEGYKDIAITEVSSDSFAFVRNPWHIQLTIKVKGYSNLTLPVTLKEGENIILSRPLELLPGKETYIVTMKAVPYSLGSTLYTVTVPPLADELVSENNSVSVMVHVIRDKVRVLHLCGRPSWDELFLRRILKKDPSVDLISFFILRTPTDLVEASSRELSLIPFPAEELFTKVLESFDLVIFQNFDYRPYDSTFLRFAYYLANVQKFVKETGGGFLMVGGELAFAHGGYDGTPIEDILPVQLNEERDTIDTQNFRFLLTPQGMSHPITTLEYDTERNQKTWSDLPELRGLNMISATKAGAITLGVHPQGKQPVLA